MRTTKGLFWLRLKYTALYIRVAFKTGVFSGWYAPMKYIWTHIPPKF